MIVFVEVFVLIRIVFSTTKLFETHQCKTLPHSNFLSIEDFDFICNHRKQWLFDRFANKKDFLSQITGKQLMLIIIITVHRNQVNNHEEWRKSWKSKEYTSIYPQFILLSAKQRLYFLKLERYKDKIKAATAKDNEFPCKKRNKCLNGKIYGRESLMEDISTHSSFSVRNFYLFIYSGISFVTQYHSDLRFPIKELQKYISNIQGQDLKYNNNINLRQSQITGITYRNICSVYGSHSLKTR